MTGKIVIGGEEYGIRCDMNVIEAIENHFGGIEGVTKERSIAAAKFLAAEMINEHNYVVHSPERVTPQEVGAKMTPAEYGDVWRGVIECFIDCVAVKKKIVREDEWKVDAMSGSEEDNSAVRSSRLRIMAVRTLGYTHTEYGMRPMGRLIEELSEMAEMRNTRTTAGDSGDWIDEEAI